MAASLIRQDAKTRFAIFAIDGEFDVRLLPTSKDKGKENLSTVYDCIMGSIANVISDNTIYYELNGSDVWVKKTKSGGGVDPGDYEWADESDIDNLFP